MSDFSILDGEFAKDWERVGLDSGPVNVASHRSTTSSRLPGRALEGTVWHAVRRAEVCTGCGRLTGGFPGAHAPHHGADPKQVIDCSGRVCVRGASGFYEVSP